MKVIVIYETYKNDRQLDDERYIGEFNSLKEAKYFLETKYSTKTSLANLSKMIKTKGTINKKYKVFKMNF